SSLGADLFGVHVVEQPSPPICKNRVFIVVLLETVLWFCMGQFLMIVEQSLERIETKLSELAEMVSRLLAMDTTKECFEVEEFALRVKRAAFTVREWARLGRINAQKKRSGRGKYLAWMINFEEVLRYEREGLLPLKPRSKAC